MNEMQRMNKEIRRMTVIFMLVVALACAFMWQDALVRIAGGVLVGGCAGLIGFAMIVSMSANIEHVENARRKGYMGYITRYALYALIFAVCIYRGINVFAILAGFMCHKASIIVYTFRYRKELD